MALSSAIGKRGGVGVPGDMKIGLAPAKNNHGIKTRPLSITIISWLFITAGVIGLAYHSSEFNAQHPFEHEFGWVCLIRLIAIISGAFMLRGRNWARWLLLVWIAYHVVLSAFHSVMEFAVHGFLFAVVGYFLFRARASAYFASPRKQSGQAY